MSAKKEKEAKPAHDANHGEDASKSKGGGLVGKLLLAAFVCGVIVTEAFVFFFLVPSGEEVAILAEQRLIATAQEIDAQERETSHEEDRIVEFDLGTFSVSFIPASSDRRYRVEFKLFGTLHSKDLDRLTELFEENQGRFRHRMQLEIRNASMQELEETNLGLIQRRILATSTELLGEAILLSVGFNDYQVLEE